MAHSYGGYTTNVPLDELLDGKAWVAFEADGEPLDPGARRPGAAAGAAPLLLEEREVGARARHDAGRRARVLGAVRLPPPRRPVAGGAVLVTSDARRPRRLRCAPRGIPARDAAAPETPTARRIVLDVPTWPGNDAGPAPRRPADRARRLPGDPLVLDRVRRRGHPRRARRRRAPRRRGLAVPRPRPARRRQARAARPAGRVLRVGSRRTRGRRARTGAAHRGRLRRRAAVRDGPAHADGGRRHRVPAAVLGAHPGGRVLPRRADRARQRRPRASAWATSWSPAGPSA